jgi:hypothetical protein
MSVPHPEQRDEPGAGPRLPLLFQLVYCSRAVPGIDDTAIGRILESARRRNPVYGITGLLVFGGGVFFQWLEGPRETVTQLLAILRSDPRHHDVVVLSETEEVRERLFPDWSMERVTTDDIRDVLADARDTAEDPRSAATLELMIEHLDSGPLTDLRAA